MRVLTDRQLRIGLRSPIALARGLRRAEAMPIRPDTPRSPQGKAIRAEINGYFASGRTRSLPESFDARVSKWKRRETAATEIANARRMLERFQAFERDEGNPTEFGIAKSAIRIFGLDLELGVDVAYETSAGWVLRQFLVDDEIVRLAQIRLYALATAIHFEARRPGAKVARVEVWDLRRDNVRPGWERRWLEGYVPDLQRRFEAIRDALGDKAA